MTAEDLQAFTALTEYALNSSSVQLMMGKLLALHVQTTEFSIQARERIEKAARSDASPEDLDAMKEKFQIEELKLADQLAGQMQNLLQQLSLLESYQDQMHKYLAEMKQTVQASKAEG
jgi:hypothetical protein